MIFLRMIRISFASKWNVNMALYSSEVACSVFLKGDFEKKYNVFSSFMEKKGRRQNNT